MILYLGSERVSVTFSGGSYKVNTIIDESLETKIRLVSSDDYILKDSNEVYLLPREGVN